MYQHPFYHSTLSFTVEVYSPLLMILAHTLCFIPLEVVGIPSLLPLTDDKSALMATQGAAPAADGLLMKSAALPLLLRHHSFAADSRILSILLMVSKRMRQAIHVHCRGIASVQFAGREHMLQFAAWLKTHAQLLRQLYTGYAGSNTTQTAQEASVQLGMALAEVLQRQQLLQLQNLELADGAANDLIMPLLLHCSASLDPGVRGLTSLTLQSFGNASRPVPVAPIVAALTGLQELDLSKYFSTSDAAQMQQQLPATLTSLSLTMWSDDDTDWPQQPVQLGHLTRLCSLKIDELFACSQLPRSLCELSVLQCSSMEPLLPCKQLQVLVMSGPELAPAGELCKLSALTKLTYLDGLQYDSRATADAAAAAWSVPPLTSAVAHLSLQNSSLGQDTFQRATIQQIGHLRGLTQLEIWGGMHPLPVTPAEFAGVLLGLTALQVLELADWFESHMLVPPSAAAGDGQPDMQPVCQAIAHLPKLESLHISGAGLNIAAVVPLTRLTQLKKLKITGKDFDDLALVKLVYSLTGLEQLSIPDNPVTDVALLVIGQHLQQLTELVLDGCEQITDVGVQQLMGLPSLQVFDDDGTHISPEVLASMYIFVARNRCEALETRH